MEVLRWGKFESSFQVEPFRTEVWTSALPCKGLANTASVCQSAGGLGAGVQKDSQFRWKVDASVSCLMLEKSVERGRTEWVKAKRDLACLGWPLV